MEAPRLQPDLPEPPRLRLLEGRSPALDSSAASLRAWIVLFGSLSFSGGHGVFLAAALTRLSGLPGRAELGGPLESAVIAWFVAAAPLALASAGLRRRFLRLSGGAAWSLASTTLALSLAAYGVYLRAIALG